MSLRRGAFAGSTYEKRGLGCARMAETTGRFDFNSVLFGCLTRKPETWDAERLWKEQNGLAYLHRHERRPHRDDDCDDDMDDALRQLPTRPTT